jgi:radical SAM superfamily enzyme YgiQ (UPF0313 family)
MPSIYEGAIWRPPSEARSLILQATIGCSNNSCTFCGSYKSKPFRIKPPEEIKADVYLIGDHYKHIERIFLADGDALVIKTPQLIEILDFLSDTFPRLQRVGVYASPQNLLLKSTGELRELSTHGLGIVYLGVETGSDRVLERVKKGVTRDEMITAGRKVVQAGIPLSVTIIIGLGGQALSHRHAERTASILNQITPDYVGALTLMLVEGTELYEAHASGTFELLSPRQTLQEMYWLIESMECETLFRSNHASTYLSLGGYLPGEKEHLLTRIDDALEKGMFRQEYMRGL